MTKRMSQFSSVTQLYPTLCDPMDCSTPTGAVLRAEHLQLMLMIRNTTFELQLSQILKSSNQKRMPFFWIVNLYYKKIILNYYILSFINKKSGNLFSQLFLLSLFSRSVVSDSVTPWTVALQAPLFIGFSRQEYQNVLLFPPQRDLPDPGIKPLSSALAGRFFTTEPPMKPWEFSYHSLKITLTIFLKNYIDHFS